MIELSLRTKQRYQSLQKALIRLEQIIAKTATENEEEMEEILQDSIIQRFEFTLELSWNLQKDIAVDFGFLDILGPKPAIAKAFELGLINNFETWKQMLQSRNLTSHTYDSTQAKNISKLIIQVFYPQINQFVQIITNKFNFDL